MAVWAKECPFQIRTLAPIYQNNRAKERARVDFTVLSIVPQLDSSVE